MRTAFDLVMMMEAYSDHDYFAVHHTLGRVPGSSKIIFEEGDDQHPWHDLRDCISIGYAR
jgi:hypothetical protein